MYDVCSCGSQYSLLNKALTHQILSVPIKTLPKRGPGGEFVHLARSMAIPNSPSPLFLFPFVGADFLLWVNLKFESVVHKVEVEG